MTPSLSLLICHLHGRRALLQRLRDVLDPQCVGKGVEILVNADDGQVPIGRKRNLLLAAASGRYVAFIDDDDLVSEDYVQRISGAIDKGRDVIGLELIMTRGGKHPQQCVHSIRFDRWFSEGEPPEATYYRCPNHLNPVRRELASATGFPEISQEEDRDYSYRLYTRLRTEAMLEGPIYYYLAD